MNDKWKRCQLRTDGLARRQSRRAATDPQHTAPASARLGGRSWKLAVPFTPPSSTPATQMECGGGGLCVALPVSWIRPGGLGARPSSASRVPPPKSSEDVTCKFSPPRKKPARGPVLRQHGSGRPDLHRLRIGAPRSRLLLPPGSTCPLASARSSRDGNRDTELPARGRLAASIRSPRSSSSAASKTARLAEHLALLLLDVVLDVLLHDQGLGAPRSSLTSSASSSPIRTSTTWCSS